MRLTKLQIVQSVLSALDLDNVSFIGETIESEQVAALVDSVYDDMNGDQPWPHLREIGTLEVTTTAHEMRIPDGILTVEDVWYNKNEVEYVFPKEMLTILNSRDTTLSNVDENGAYNDREPMYWTSFDDTIVVFDSHDSGLVSSLTQVDQYRMPVQMTEDTDYPDLPERFHQTLYQGVLADAFYTLKGDVTGFNIWNNRYKRNKAAMDRWAKRVNRQTKAGDNIDYSRKWGI